VLRQDPPRLTFAPKGAYKLIRHPIYLSFLGLVWLNPLMTADRMTLAVLWTVHLFVGSYLKDRRLVRYVGEPYRQYQMRVPGYPLFPGPLGRRRRPMGNGPDRVDEPARGSLSASV
jgi:protein-S-isoprenylcysteine O-methyltransferase Ste14